MATLDRAIALAAKAHEGQTDKQGAPYILHPLRVMMACRADGLSDPHQIVAVLHDVIEDTDTKIEEIREAFGDTVADALDAVSRKSEVTYLGYIRAMRKYPIAVEVKKRDIIDNCDFRRFFYGVGYERMAKAMAILTGMAE